MDMVYQLEKFDWSMEVTVYFVLFIVTTAATHQEQNQSVILANSQFATCAQFNLMRSVDLVLE